MTAYMLSFLIGVVSSIAAAVVVRKWIDHNSARFTMRRVLNDIRMLHKAVINDNFIPDYVVTVDRNAAIVGGILAGFWGFDTVISLSTVNLRLADGSRSIKIAEAHLPNPGAISGKRLLVLICFNDTGTSLETVIRCLSENPYNPMELRAAALYTSVSPKIRPQYSAREVGRNLKFPISDIVDKMPWMCDEWRHVLGAERLRARAKAG